MVGLLRYVVTGLWALFYLIWTGILVQVMGMAFALLAQAYLGRNWSGTVTIKADHELISRGPYAITHHPIYSGILLGLVGTSFAYGVMSGLVGCTLMLAASLYKLNLEEQFLSVELPSAYDQYRRRVKALIPWIW
jgi:protein-S-isoprenylcysteine O-methyltransferase Ste14